MPTRGSLHSPTAWRVVKRAGGLRLTRPPRGTRGVLLGHPRVTPTWGWHHQLVGPWGATHILPRGVCEVRHVAFSHCFIFILILTYIYFCFHILATMGYNNCSLLFLLGAPGGKVFCLCHYSAFLEVFQYLSLPFFKSFVVIFCTMFPREHYKMGGLTFYFGILVTILS